MNEKKRFYPDEMETVSLHEVKDYGTCLELRIMQGGVSKVFILSQGGAYTLSSAITWALDKLKVT